MGSYKPCGMVEVAFVKTALYETFGMVYIIYYIISPQIYTLKTNKNSENKENTKCQRCQLEQKSVAETTGASIITATPPSSCALATYILAYTITFAGTPNKTTLTHVSIHIQSGY